MVDNRHPRPRAGPPQPQPGQRLRPVGLPERTAGTPAGPGRLGEAIRRRAEALGGGAARRAPPQGARGGSVPSPLWCPRPVSAKAGPARDRPATAPRNASSGARPVPRRREDGASARGFYDRRNPPDQRFGDGLRHPAPFSSMLLHVHAGRAPRRAGARQGPGDALATWAKVQGWGPVRLAVLPSPDPAGILRLLRAWEARRGAVGGAVTLSYPLCPAGGGGRRRWGRAAP